MKVSIEKKNIEMLKFRHKRKFLLNITINNKTTTTVSLILLPYKLFFIKQDIMKILILIRKEKEREREKAKGGGI